MNFSSQTVIFKSLIKNQVQLGKHLTAAKIYTEAYLSAFKSINAWFTEL